MICASGEIGVEVMMDLCQYVLNGRGMPNEWKISMIMPLFKGKDDDVMSCGSYKGAKLLKHAMKIVERVLERQIQTLICLNKMQFGFMPGRGTVDAVLIVRRMQEKYQKMDQKLHMCFVDIEKALIEFQKSDAVAMRKKGLSEVMIRAIMSLYDGAKTRVKVRAAYSKEFEVEVGVQQGSVLSPLLFAIVVDVITEKTRRWVVDEKLYADDLVLMSETMEDLKKTLGIGRMHWKASFNGHHQKNKSDSKRVGRRTVQKQDRLI